MELDDTVCAVRLEIWGNSPYPNVADRHGGDGISCAERRVCTSARVVMRVDPFDSWTGAPITHLYRSEPHGIPAYPYLGMYVRPLNHRHRSDRTLLGRIPLTR